MCVDNGAMVHWDNCEELPDEVAARCGIPVRIVAVKACC